MCVCCLSQVELLLEENINEKRRGRNAQDEYLCQITRITEEKETLQEKLVNIKSWTRYIIHNKLNITII